MEEPKNESEKEQKPAMENRRCFALVIAGAYLVYTGYTLCRNVLQGTEDTGWGFFAAGIAFAVIGAGMCIIAAKNYLKNQKEKKAGEEQTQVEQAQAEAGPVQESAETLAKEEPEKKSMSITERARLTERLKETEEKKEAH